MRAMGIYMAGTSRAPGCKMVIRVPQRGCHVARCRRSIPADSMSLAPPAHASALEMAYISCMAVIPGPGINSS